jgi:hypothetical protein
VWSGKFITGNKIRKPDFQIFRFPKNQTLIHHTSQNNSTGAAGTIIFVFATSYVEIAWESVQKHKVWLANVLPILHVLHHALPAWGA